MKITKQIRKALIKLLGGLVIAVSLTASACDWPYNHYCGYETDSYTFPGCATPVIFTVYFYNLNCLYGPSTYGFSHSVLGSEQCVSAYYTYTLVDPCNPNITVTFKNAHTPPEATAICKGGGECQG